MGEPWHSLLFFYGFESVRNTFNTVKKCFRFWGFSQEGFWGVSPMSPLVDFAGNFPAIMLVNGGQ